MKLDPKFSNAAWIAATMLAAAAIAAVSWAGGARHATEQHEAYVRAQAAQTQRIEKAQTAVVHDVVVQYRDRIKTVYVKGEVIEKLVPQYITPQDDVRFGVNAGFVRLLDAAWAGDDPGPATGTDEEPAAIPLSVIADTETYNATVCRAWQEQALTVKELYRRLQAATNGKN